MLNFLKKFTPGVVVFILFSLFVLIAPGLFSNENHPFLFDGYPGIIYEILNKSVNQKWFRFIIYPGFVFFLAFYISMINQKRIIIPERNYLPSCIYIFTVLAFPEINKVNPAILASVFILVFVDKLIGLSSKDSSSFSVFESAILLSVASIIYYPSIYLFPTLIFSIIIIKKGNLREWLFSVLGFLTPFLFAITIFEVFNVHYKQFFISYIERFYLISDKFMYLMESYLPFIILFSFNVVLAVLIYFNRIQLEKIHLRKTLSWLYFFFFNVIIIIVYNPSINLEIIYIAAIPAAYIFSYYYTRARNVRVANLLISTFLLSVIFNHLSYYFLS